MVYEPSDRICAVSFGKILPDLKSCTQSPEWQEDQITVFNFELDNNLDAIEKTYKPNAYLTFGDWRKHINLSEAPFEIRKKWLSFSEDETLEEVGVKVYNFYKNFCFHPNKKHPLVSVITPTYKPSDKIFRPLNSLLEQNYKNWEWILYDDSDDDGKTFDFLSKIASTDHRIKVYKSDRRSGRIGQVKKNAFSLGSGDYLCELDHDDSLTENCLSWIVASFDKYQEAGMCYTDCAEYIELTGECTNYGAYAYGYGKYRDEVYKGIKYSVMDYPRLNQKTIRHIVGVPNHVRCWRSSTYHAIGGHNPNLHVADDYELIVKTFLHSRVCHIPKLGYIQYANSDHSNTTDRRRPEIQRLVEMIKSNYDQQIHDRLIELGLPDDVWNEHFKFGDPHLEVPMCDKHACIISEV